MSARVMQQNPEIGERFHRQIEEKVTRKRVLLEERIDRKAFGCLGWLLKPLAVLHFDSTRERDAAVGEDEEREAALNLSYLLPDSWTMFSDVVIEPERRQFAQIDHLLIGPAGVYIVETKAWRGAVRCYHDRWKRKEADLWELCKSPTRQNVRHAYLFKKWAERTLADRLPAGRWIHPVVLLPCTNWLRVDVASMPVFESESELVEHIERLSGEVVLSPEQISLLAELVASAAPYGEAAPSPAGDGRGAPALQVKEGRRIRDGRPYVTVDGSREAAEKVRQEYLRKGRLAAPLHRDKEKPYRWFFYLDDGGGVGRPDGGEP